MLNLEETWLGILEQKGPHRFWWGLLESTDLRETQQNSAIVGCEEK